MEVYKRYRFKSPPKNTPYAPSLDVSIDEFRLPVQFCKDLEQLMHQEVKDLSYKSWHTYNIFSIDSPVITRFKSFIDDMLINYESTKNLWINGWVNYSEEGECIRRHNHSIHENSYLTGSLCLCDRDDVSTYFWVPIISDDRLYGGPLEFKSLAGRLIVFPSYIPHEVTTLPIGKGTRMTVAFDLIVDDAITYFKKNSNNPEDPLYRAIKYDTI